jgi:hypothetical protein
MPIRAAVPVVLAIAALAAAAPAQGASWTAPDLVASSGASSGPRLAADARDRLAVGFIRRFEAPREPLDTRVEVRRGTTRSGIRGASTVVARERGANVDDLDVAFPGTDDDLAVAWRRAAGNSRRGFAATVDDRGAPSAPRDLAAADRVDFLGGDGDDLLLGLPHRSAFRAAPFAGGAYEPVRDLGDIPADAAALADARGTVVLAWTRGRTLQIAQRPPGGTTSAPAVIPSPGYARQPQLALTADGHVVVVWLSNEGDGNTVMAVSRAAGATAFGAPRRLTGPVGAFAPRVAGSSAGELLVTFVQTGLTEGGGVRPGQVHILRATPDVTKVSPAVKLSVGSERTFEAPIDGHATDAAYVAWTVAGRGAHPVRVRRVAPGGIVGAAHTLTRDRAGSAPVVRGTAGGRAAVAWVEVTGRRPLRSRVMLSIFR